MNRRFTANSNSGSIRAVTFDVIRRRSTATSIASTQIIVTNGRQTRTEVNPRGTHFHRRKNRFFPFARRGVGLFYHRSVVIGLIMVGAWENNTGRQGNVTERRGVNIKEFATTISRVLIGTIVRSRRQSFHQRRTGTRVNVFNGILPPSPDNVGRSEYVGNLDFTNRVIACAGATRHHTFAGRPHSFVDNGSGNAIFFNVRRIYYNRAG